MALLDSVVELVLSVPKNDWKMHRRDEVFVYNIIKNNNEESGEIFLSRLDKGVCFEYAIVISTTLSSVHEHRIEENNTNLFLSINTLYDELMQIKKTKSDKDQQELINELIEILKNEK